MGRATLTLAIILGLVAGVIAYGKTRAKPVTPPPPTNFKAPKNSANQKNTNNIEIEFEEAIKVIIECESADVKLWQNMDPVEGKEILRKVTERHGQDQELGYLEIPDGCVPGCYNEKKGVPGALPGKAFYPFEIPEDGDYYLYLRAKWYDNCGDSVYVRFDKGTYLSIEDSGRKMGDTYQWAWHPLRLKGNLQKIHLTAGKHTLELSTKEDGPKFDKFLISSDANVPTQEVINP